jgi:metal transporter CNNM
MNIPIIILEILGLVCLSAIFSGLNIALMSLSASELKRKAESGDNKAKKVLPLRRNSHLSLASILFANVAVISASSLVLERHFEGIIAGLISTILIVVFGEVIPQAFFVRFALKFCAFFAPLVKFVILVTYPISKPIQLILDKLLGHEKSQLHSRHELGLLISEHADSESELDEDEIEIMRSTLMLSEKRVRDIMKPMSEVFWLEQNELIDGEKIDQIKEMGWSRIPVFNKGLTKCRGILLMKDLVDMDFDEKPMALKGLPLHEATTTGSMTALDTMFRKFIVAKSHLIPVEKDDEYIGIITIEDLVEEILGHEIADETDIVKRRS